MRGLYDGVSRLCVLCWAGRVKCFFVKGDGADGGPAWFLAGCRTGGLAVSQVPVRSRLQLAVGLLCWLWRARWPSLRGPGSVSVPLPSVKNQHVSSSLCSIKTRPHIPRSYSVTSKIISYTSYVIISTFSSSLVHRPRRENNDPCPLSAVPRNHTIHPPSSTRPKISPRATARSIWSAGESVRGSRTEHQCENEPLASPGAGCELCRDSGGRLGWFCATMVFEATFPAGWPAALLGPALAAWLGAVRQPFAQP